VGDVKRFAILELRPNNWYVNRAKLESGNEPEEQEGSQE